MGKVKKIIAGVLVVAVAGTGITAGLMQLKKNSQKTVSVTSVSGLLQDYYTPNTTIDGTVSSSATQTVTGDKDLIIDQVYVAKGDAVKKDDPLISFDTTLVEMELNIAKLKKQKQEQDLNKAVNRLNSLLNGGPVEETDGSTDADNLGTHGTDSDSADDLAQDNTMSSAADMSGTYLAAAIHPLLVTAFTDGRTTDTTADAASTGTDTDTADASSAETITGPADASNDIPSYTDPSASDFEDGSNKNSFNSGTNDSPVPSPTPTPVLDDHTNYFDPYYIKGDPNITDGNEPFYQKLDGESIPVYRKRYRRRPVCFPVQQCKRESHGYGFLL